MDRSTFFRQAATALLSLPVLTSMSAGNKEIQTKKRIGIVGLDTSHSEVFAQLINEPGGENTSYQVVAAYQPPGNRDVLNLAPSIKQKLQDIGVNIVDSLETLLNESDAILLESIDGTSHLSQALSIFKAGKPVFIDKPLAASLEDTRKIIQAAKQYQTPFFSSSSLRFDPMVQKVRNGSIGKVNGADVYVPATMEKAHLDMAWYGIHGIEMLYAVMGPGCHRLQRLYTPDTDLVTAVWKDGRFATLRGIRNAPSDIAGIAHGSKGSSPLGPFSQQAYQQLIKQILLFFQTGQPPVEPEETFEIFKFMQACDLSRKKNGAFIAVDSIK